VCNDFEQAIAYQAYVELMSSTPWEPPPFEDPAILAPVDHIKITDPAAVIRLEDGQPKLSTLRWSFPPSGKGGPIFNFRSEGRHFTTGQRCLVPASAFYEFTDNPDPKTKRKDRWKFGRKDGKWMAIAGIWRPSAGGNHPPTFTLLTTDPGPDVQPIHNRQIVILEPSAWKDWLTAGRAEGEVLRPSPPDTFSAHRA
jgi:putative SOS response-associated peptidase YedK